ncbi:MAG: dTDP-4-dehydrorhamnose 3,5-epimerase [bacterium]|nr:dTDP-4-dehydrorhamnose 3,5-epimerase [bacterium]
MTVQTLDIPDVLVLEPEVHEDVRGHFFESWNDATFSGMVGLGSPFVQDNESRSRLGVIRGLHYQLPNPQGKLVRVIAGQAFAVAVDIRRSSDSFGRWVSTTISADNRRQLWVPPGFAHGFLALSDPTDVVYKVTAFYSPEHSRAIRWGDPDIGIRWPLDDMEPLLSDIDLAAPLLRDAEVFD